ncbi:MFS transporter [Pleomorphomonas carboxyditropha]|uniref:MFS transporter n=1 Tax=Pleomorphomonas carboxyditropha TaxID=2023338 RepID=A0A2G9WR70_9HYPH|nr:MFS transporter [Pleomorphomonas carboxyditropha]PIO97145.1 MFS transporter [Pleomorphomonas carboxyditropha]
MSHTTASAAPAPAFFDQPKAVWATIFACTVGFMSIGLVDPILTSIARGLDAGPAEVSLLFTSYFFVTSVMMLVTGFVSSRLGSRSTMMVGAALIVVFAALAGNSTSVTELVLFRGGWGLGNAFFVVTGLSVLVAVTRGGTGRAVLLYEAAMGLGLSGGPLLGALLGSYSWRWPFFGTATLMAVGLIAIALFLPPLARPAVKTGLTAPVRALGHPGLLTVAIGAFFYYFAFFTVLAFAPFVLDMSAMQVGGIFFGWGVLLAIFSVFVAPRVEARFGLIPVTTVCLTVMAVLLVVMGIAPKGVVAACVMLSGAVMGICNTLFTELALEISDAPRPVASAGYNFLRWFAGVIAPYAVPKVAEFLGVEVAFGLAAAAALAAPLTFYLRRRHLARPGVVAANAVSPLLAAVDGSLSDAAVLDRAAAFARAEGRPVLVAHVRMAEVVDEEEADLEDAATAEGIVGTAIERLKAAGIAAEGLVIDAAAGAAARKVSDLADAVGAGRIVVGAVHPNDPEDLRHGSFSAALLALRGPDRLVVVGDASDRRNAGAAASALPAGSARSA